MEISLSEHFTTKKLVRFVLPCIAMMITTSIYGIVDGFFISNYAGKNAFATMNLIMPIIMALSAFGLMIGSGGSTLVAFTLGQGKKKKANEIFSMLVEFMMLVGIVVSVIGIIFMPQIVKMLGVSSLIYDDCIIYGRIALVPLPFFMLQNSFESFLVTAERARIGLGLAIVMGLLNVIFDFLFVYVYQGGIIGVGVATAIVEILGGMIPFLYFRWGNSSLLQLTLVRLDFLSIRKACINGSSELLTSIAASFVEVLFNFQLMNYAAENGVVAYGIVMNISFIFMAFFGGYALGIGPIVGYNYGAKKYKELKNIFHESLKIIFIAAIIMTILGELFVEPVCRVFVGYDITLFEVTKRAMKIYSLSFLICGFNILSSAFFVGMNDGRVCTFISLIRTLVIEVATILILPTFFGIDGIWSAIVLTEIITVFITMAFFICNQKRYQFK